MGNLGKGLFFTISAYLLWGVLPLYWHLLDFAGPLHILGCRVLFSFCFTAVVLLIRRDRAWLGAFRRRFWPALAGSLLITANWGLYIWAVNTGRTIQASLGYYINPLVSVLLGLVFLKEHLNALQWAAFALAATGVLLLTFFSHVFPLASLLLALTFGLYGLYKKKDPSGVFAALNGETFAVLPIGLALLLLPPGDLGQLRALSPGQWLLLASSGPATAIPLLAFAKGAKHLSLSAIGFLQFINPTMLFFLSVFVFHEPFPRRNLIAFAFIWAAVLLYCASGARRPKRLTPVP
jgi:chloramphenicol-sensitive protein RarD